MDRLSDEETEHEVGEAPAIDLDHVHEDMYSSLSGESIDDEDELRLSFSDLSNTFDELLPVPGTPNIGRLVPNLGDLDMVLQYAVHVAQGDGAFEPTEHAGVLTGERTYEIVVLDEFEFGFNERRGQYEILLDPNAPATGFHDLEGGQRCEIRVSGDGTVQLLKPQGMRVDIHPVLRHKDGTRGSIRIHEGMPEEASAVVLPYDPMTITEEFAEYMIGLGLTNEPAMCYAFTVYIAIKLQT
jgi:hypothetical protein